MNIDDIPDVRDGLTRLQRAVLYVLHEAEKERPGRSVPTVMLYGRVLEFIDVSEAEFQDCLSSIHTAALPAEGAP